MAANNEQPNPRYPAPNHTQPYERDDCSHHNPH